jgi:hypothetical protein
MFASSSEAIRRQKELERLQGITPETKRYNEIKAGVITGSVGLALMIFLAVFMQGIIIERTCPPLRGGTRTSLACWTDPGFCWSGFDIQRLLRQQEGH